MKDAANDGMNFSKMQIANLVKRNDITTEYHQTIGLGYKKYIPGRSNFMRIASDKNKTFMLSNKDTLIQTNKVENSINYDVSIYDDPEECNDEMIHYGSDFGEFFGHETRNEASTFSEYNVPFEYIDLSDKDDANKSNQIIGLKISDNQILSDSETEFQDVEMDHGINNTVNTENDLSALKIWSSYLKEIPELSITNVHKYCTDAIYKWDRNILIEKRQTIINFDNSKGKNLDMFLMFLNLVIESKGFDTGKYSENTDNKRLGVSDIILFQSKHLESLEESKSENIIKFSSKVDSFPSLNNEPYKLNYCSKLNNINISNGYKGYNNTHISQLNENSDINYINNDGGNIKVEEPINCKRSDINKYYEGITNHNTKINTPLNDSKNSVTRKSYIDAKILELDYLRNKQQSNTNEPDSVILHDIKQLFVIMGLPYINAPSEAEAQCAFLSKNGLVDGVVSEDNDALLFGAGIQYRHIFKRNLIKDQSGSFSLKYTEYDTDKLIDLAHLLGSDYTIGIKGVGPKLAVLINDFDWPQQNNISPLNSMINWYRNPTDQEMPKWTKKLRKILDEYFKDNYIFPNPEAERAFKSPIVDTDLKKFEFSGVDPPSLYKFMLEKCDWDKNKVDMVFGPINVAKKKRGKIYDYFNKI